MNKEYTNEYTAEIVSLIDQTYPGLYQGLLVWISPISCNLEHRIIYSPSYNEVLDWIDSIKDKYKNIIHSFYVDGCFRDGN